VSPDFPVYDEHYRVLGTLVDELRARSWLHGRVSLELWSHVPNRAVSERVEAALVGAGCTVADASSILRRVRGIKSPAEIAYLEEGAHIADIGP
jgi:Xaa-Pro aminopeptidase